VRTLSISSLKRWITLGLATVAVASLAPARPAHAADAPDLVGQTFSLHTSPSHNGTDSFKITWEDAAGNLIVEFKRAGVKTIGIGKLTPYLFSSTRWHLDMQVDATPGSSTETHFEGALRQWGPGKHSSSVKTEWMVAGSYRDLRAGSFPTSPSPFCGSSEYGPIPW
jgi:hypothetical protein